MKTLKFKIFAILAIITLNVAGQEPFTKKFNQVFDVSKTDKFVISNKFGRIQIENSNDNKITIEAEIIVKTASQNKADRIFDQITIDIKKENDIIYAITNIDDISEKHASFEINYYVLMPAYINIDLTNKYGQVNINELTGKYNINVMYGSLTANNFTDGQKPYSTVDLSYCDNSDIKNINRSKILVSYSKLSVNNAQSIILSSKYSKIKINQAINMAAKIAYDDLDIETINNIAINGKYSDIKINTLKTTLKSETSYGNIRVNEVNNEFETIESKSKFGNVKFAAPINTSYIVDLVCEYGNIKHNNLSTINKNRNGQTEKIYGSNGQPPYNRTINIDCQYGEIDLR